MIDQNVKNNLLNLVKTTPYKEAEYFIKKLAARKEKDDKSTYFNEDVLDEDDRDYDEFVEVFNSYDLESDEFVLEFNCGSNYLEVVFSTGCFSYNFTSDSIDPINSGFVHDEIFGDVLAKVPYTQQIVDKLVLLVNVIDQEIK